MKEESGGKKVDQFWEIYMWERTLYLILIFILLLTSYISSLLRQIMYVYIPSSLLQLRITQPVFCLLVQFNIYCYQMLFSVFFNVLLKTIIIIIILFLPQYKTKQHSILQINLESASAIYRSKCRKIKISVRIVQLKWLVSITLCKRLLTKQ